MLKVDLWRRSARWRLAVFTLTATLAIVLCAAPALAADLSPGSWPASTRKALEGEEFFFFPPFAGPVRGRSMLVTGTLSPVAVHAGVEALRRGGTAADAAATVALTQVATNLGSIVSYAGRLQLLYFEARTKRVYDLDAGWASYEDETDPTTIPPADISFITGAPPLPPVAAGRGRQTLVPGFMAGIQAMHARFGRLPFADLFQPAIWYAENGVRISPSAATTFGSEKAQLWRTPEGRRFASMPDGELPKAGDLFRQPDLARTLKAVAAQGSGYMYTGDWARAYVAAVRAEGGKATLADLARYRPEWREPLSVQFAGTTVFGPAANSTGNCPVLEALNLLSGLRIESLGPYWRDPRAFADYVRAMRVGMYDGQAAGCSTRLTPEFAQAVAPKLASILGEPTTVAAPENHTEAVVVVDRWGNVAALVHTINGGRTGIVVGGIPLSNAAGIHQADLAAIKPGARLKDELSPVIALRDEKPVFATAAVGVSEWMETTRLIAGKLAGGLDLQTLMSAPPLVRNVTAADSTKSLRARPEIIPVGAYDAKTKEGIAATGIAIREETAQRVAGLRGSAVVAEIDQPGGSPHTVEVPSVVGFAESDLQRGARVPKGLLLTPQTLDRYVGDYEIRPGLDTHVFRDGARLFGQMTHFPPVELIADAENHFIAKSPDTQVTFICGPSGQAVEQIITTSGVDLQARRIAP